MFQQQLVLSSAADIRDRFLRTLSGLDEAITAADEGTRTVLQTYRQIIAGLLVEQQGLVADHLEGLLAGYDDDPRNWPARELVDLSHATVSMFDLLSIKHYEAANHLPSVSQAPQDLLYLLMRSVRFSLMSREHTRLLSVQQSRSLSWEATRFAELEGDRPNAAAIAVPWLETLTPLRWPLAVHELGHYFLPDAEPVRQRMLAVASANDWRGADLTSFKEIIADAVAQRALGDAYALALAREGYLLSYKTHLDGGISIADRLQLLEGPADLIDNLPVVWGLSDRAPGNSTPPPPPTPLDQQHLMREQAVAMVGPAERNDPDKVRAARALIRSHEPPAAALQSSTLTTAARARLTDVLQAAVASGVVDLQGADVTIFTDLAVHRSLTDGEILEAASLEDCERDVATMLRDLTAPVTAESIQDGMREVNQRDVWLARALQSAAVHRWIDTNAELDAELAAERGRR